MALQRQPLKQGIITLMTDMMERAEPSYDEFAERLSMLIEDYVKGLQITYVPANPQNPPASPFMAGPYPVTGTFGYILS